MSKARTTASAASAASAASLAAKALAKKTPPVISLPKDKVGSFFFIMFLWGLFSFFFATLGVLLVWFSRFFFFFFLSFFWFREGFWGMGGRWFV